MKKRFFLAKWNKFVLATIGGLLILGCEKPAVPENPTPPRPPIPVEPPEPPQEEFSQPSQSQLNVIYFIPNDVEPHEDYQERLTWALLHMRTYYAEQLKLNGFEEKKFGLQEDPENPNFVKIILVDGKEGAASYPYSGGGAKARNEIIDYFNNSEAKPTSEHYLVFLPDHGVVGVPFYGLGKWAFVRDYENGFAPELWRGAMGYPTNEHRWLGGTIHELGHGLNLPHNRQKAGDNFVAMMGNGNTSYWKKPTGVKLTKASALILDATQVFHKDSSIAFYQEAADIKILEEKIYATKTDLHYELKVEPSVPLNGIIFYQDPKVSNSDGAYNAISWAQRADEFTKNEDDVCEIEFSMPLSDVDDDFKSHPFTLNVRLVHENGNSSGLSHQFNYVEGIPDIDYEFALEADLDKTNWEIEEVSSEDLRDKWDGPWYAEKVLDNDPITYWRSDFGADPDFPQTMVIDMQEVLSLSGISIQQVHENKNGMVQDFEVYTSVDHVSYTLMNSYTAKFGLQDRQQFVFDTKTDARYVKLVFKNGGLGRPIVRFAEFGAF